MKNRPLLMFGFILLILIGSIQFLTVFAGDPIPDIDITLDQAPGTIKVDLGGYQTEHGIVIGSGTTGSDMEPPWKSVRSSDVDYAIVLDIIPLSNFQQNVQDEIVASSQNIRKNISTVTKQADSSYEFYVSSPGHKTVSELTLNRSSNETDTQLEDEIAVYRLSINSDDLSNEQLQKYIKSRIAAHEAAHVVQQVTQKEQAEADAAKAQAAQIKTGIKGEEKEDVARPKVPDWIKNNAEWFSQGAISEDDFVKGLEWMVNNGIIRIDSVAIKEGVK